MESKNVASELVFDFGKTVKDIVNVQGLEKNKEKNGESEPNRNYETLIRNFVAYQNFAKEKGVNIQKLLDDLKAAKSKLQINDLLRKDLDHFFGCCEVDIEVSKLMTFFIYFRQKIAYIDELPADMRVIALEQADGVLSTLRSSIQFGGVFRTSFCHIVNRKYDGLFMTPANSTFMCHAVGVFILQMFFSVEQYAFLADHYYKKGDTAKYEEHLNNVFFYFQ